MNITIKARGRTITGIAHSDSGVHLAEARATYISGDNLFRTRHGTCVVVVDFGFEKGGMWVTSDTVVVGKDSTRARHDKVFRAWFKAEGRAKLAVLAAKVEAARASNKPVDFV